MSELTEYDGTDYRETRDVLRRMLEGSTVERVDVDVPESGPAYVQQITLRLANNDEIYLEPAGSADMGDLRITVGVLDGSTSESSGR